MHLLITYLIKGTVIARACHKWLCPSTVNDYTHAGTLTWCGITTAILASCYAVAIAKSNRWPGAYAAGW